MHNSERIAVLDALRGLALGGILCVNVMQTTEAYLTLWTDINRLSITLIFSLMFGKFITLFALLFGVGFAVQSQKLSTAGYIRRLSFLLILGLVHGYVLWHGDILATYALLAFPLLFTRKWKIGTVKVWIVLTVVMWVLIMVFLGSPEGEQSVSSTLPEPTFSTSPWFHPEYSYTLMLGIVSAPWIHALFLAGKLLWDSGTLRWHAPEMWRAFLIITVPVGIAINFGFVITPEYDMAWRSQTVSGFALAVPYFCFMMWQYQTGKRFHALEAVGRMALSNYIAQSLCLVVWLKLNPQPEPTEILGYGIVLFAAQMLLSSVWLKHFQYGILEWLWRMVTYAKILPLRRVS